MKTKETKPIEKIATIVGIEPIVEEKCILVRTQSDSLKSLRPANRFYFESKDGQKECGKVSASQLGRIFKNEDGTSMSPTEIAVQADDLVKKAIKVRYEMEEKGEYKNYSFYPLNTSITADAAARAFAI